jgi:hypothetical protein
MATDARNILNYQGSDADHRTFAQAIHDMLLAVGLTQTTDTGQATLSTLTRPTTNNSSGYEVFRFNDAEQATLGCFLKVEYATGNAVTTPGLKLTVGTATNGAGTVSNSLAQTATSNSWATVTDSVAQVRPAYASYAEGQLIIAFGLDPIGSRGAWYYIGRPRLYDGSRTTDGLLFMHAGRTSGHGVIRAGGGGPALVSQVSDLPVLEILGGYDDQAGANVALYPTSFAVNGNLRFGSIFGYRAAAIASDSQQSVNIFGSNRNYRTLGGTTVITDTSIAVPFF